MKIGKYKASNIENGFAVVNHIMTQHDKAWGLFFIAEGDRPEQITWSLDGNSHAGRRFNIDLDQPL